MPVGTERSVMVNKLKTAGFFVILTFSFAGWVKGTEVVSIWGGARETVVLKSDGTVWDWGFNWFGHLGDGTFSVFSPPDFTNDKHVPLEVHGPGGSGYLN